MYCQTQQSRRQVKGLQCVGDHQAEPVLVDDSDAVHELAVAHRAGRGKPLHLPPAIAIDGLVNGPKQTFWAAVGHQSSLPFCASCIKATRWLDDRCSGLLAVQ